MYGLFVEEKIFRIDEELDRQILGIGFIENYRYTIDILKSRRRWSYGCDGEAEDFNGFGEV